MNKLTGLILAFILVVFSNGCGLIGDGARTSDTNSSVETEGEGASSLSDSNNTEADSDSQKPGSGKTIVRFAKGGTSKSYKGSVAAGGTMTYVINAAKDQMMSVKVDSTEGTALFTVKSPVGALLSDGEDGVAVFSKTLTAGGNYTVEVKPAKEKAQFEISFSVTGGKTVEDEDEGDESGSGGMTKTVKFGKGATSANYEGAVIRGDRDTYILGAGKGQTMNVTISALENNAVFQIKGPGGYLPGTKPGDDARSFNGVLPSDGKYQVIVGGTRGNATYKIRFSIK